MFAIDVKNLTKNFEDINAVDNISFKVKKGEIFAFLGPNGAGKSTTIKMLTTILNPSKGSIILNGHDVLHEKDAVRKSFGIIFQDTSLDDELTAYENMDYHAILYGIKKEKRIKRINDMLNYVGLLDRKNSLVKTFSGGMKRRLEIARGLLHHPKILFLDEPTLGLDVQTRSFLWRHIKKLNREKNMTVFLTTHNMDEAERIAERIAIIDEGKIMKIGTSKKIKEDTKTKSLEEAFLEITGKELRRQSVDPMSRMRKMRKLH